MLLSELTRKEKLKFLDLALHMVVIDGEPSAHEQRLLNIMLAEVGDDITKEYQFSLSGDLEDTLDFLKDRPQKTKNIIFLNLTKLLLFDGFYNTTEFFFLDNVRKTFKITETKRKELVGLLFDERDLREKALKVCLS